jgi:hypothetical protein
MTGKILRTNISEIPIQSLPGCLDAGADSFDLYFRTNPDLSRVTAVMPFACKCVESRRTTDRKATYRSVETGWYQGPGDFSLFAIGHLFSARVPHLLAIRHART